MGWKKIKEEKVWFRKMNDLSNFVAEFHFFRNHIAVTSGLASSWFDLRHNFHFFSSLFYFDKREFVISCFNDCPPCFSIFGTILLFYLSLAHMASLAIIELTLLRCVQLPVIDVENSLLMKVIYILSNLCRQSRRSMWKLSASA